MKKFLTILIPVLLSVSCSKYDLAGFIIPQKDGPNKRFEQSLSYNESQPPVGCECTTDEYRLYAFGDTHIYNSSDNLRRFVSDYVADVDAAPFAICVGDLVDASDNMSLFTDITSPLLKKESAKRLFVTVGNHDLYFDQWKEFRSSFNTATYSFEVSLPSGQKDLFLSLDSANGILGERQIDWLAKELREAEGRYRNIVVFTHTNFFMRDHSQALSGNFPIDETHRLMGLFSRYGVDLVITGHDHHREETVYGGVFYLTLDALKDGLENASYSIISIGDKSPAVSYVGM